MSRIHIYRYIGRWPFSAALGGKLIKRDCKASFDALHLCPDNASSQKTWLPSLWPNRSIALATSPAAGSVYARKLGDVDGLGIPVFRITRLNRIKDPGAPGKLTIKSQQAENHQILISVTDTGVGLPPEKVEQIFNAFFTTKPGTPVSDWLSAVPLSNRTAVTCGPPRTQGQVQLFSSRFRVGSLREILRSPVTPICR